MLGDGLVGIDPDDCRDPATGELNEMAQDIVATMQTYAEVSPTGTGIKLFCLGSLPKGHDRQNKDTGVELYTSGRFFTVTGLHVDNTPLGVEGRQDELEKVYAKYVRTREAKECQQPNQVKSLSSFDIDGFIRRNNLKVTGPEAWHDGGRRWRFVESPMCDHHSDGPYLVQFGNGALAAGCHHASCSWDWHELRAKFEPRRYKTDLGNADRFAEQHGNDLRYCHPWGKWLVWDGRRWTIDTSGEVMRRAKQTALSIFQEAFKVTDPEQRDSLIKWAFNSQKRDRLSAMITLAQSELPVGVEALDAEPWLLNVENGTIDLRTGELREHRREDFLTKLCPTPYPSSGTPELWLAFLDRIFDSNEELIRYVQQQLGMALVGEVFEHILAIFYGVGANGKTVLLETYCGMLGSDYAMTTPAGLLMTTKSDRHPTELADLHGKRFVAAIETDDGGRLSEALVKQLTGGDSIRARRMREDFWEFRPSHTVVLATNHKPTVRGTDHGIWRRLRLIPFSAIIPEPEQDKQLAKKLRAEWPLILRWAVQGCLDWQRHGFQAPAAVSAATDAYRADMDVLGEFIDECCKVGPAAEGTAESLYDKYKKWAIERGEKIESQTRFGTQLGERGFGKGRASRGPHRGRIVYEGIELALAV